MNRIYGGAVVLIALLVAACAQQTQPAEPPDTRAQDEMDIRAASKAWSEAAQAKDAEKFVSFYSDDALVILEDAPDVTGKAAIHDTLTGMMQDPAFALSFETKKVEVARSGDLAYELDTYSITMTNPATKKPATEKGEGIVIWRKQADGSWKAEVDSPVSDPPESAGAQK